MKILAHCRWSFVFYFYLIRRWPRQRSPRLKARSRTRREVSSLAPRSSLSPQRSASNARPPAMPTASIGSLHYRPETIR